MRSFEFEQKCRSAIRLGEMPTPLLYKKVGTRFAPAVLCLEVNDTDENDTKDMLEFCIQAIPELLYLDPETGQVQREKIPLSVQKELGLPVTVRVPAAEGPAGQEQKKRYYLTAEKVCCALEAGCLTAAMRQAYFRDVQPVPPEELRQIYERFFPEACARLFVK